jgi:hypothetical protein
VSRMLVVPCTRRRAFTPALIRTAPAPGVLHPR